MQAFILDDERTHALATAAVMRMKQRGRRDLRRAGRPVHALAVDHGMDAFALNRQGHGYAVMAMRALIATRRQRIDGRIDGGNGVGTWRQRRGGKLHRVAGRIRADRTAPDCLKLTLYFGCGPIRCLDRKSVV